MSFYLIADTHFLHKMLVDKGYRKLNFEETILKNLSKLTEKDVLIHLGDVGLGKEWFIHDTYIKPLKCKKWLVRGNHDNKSNTWYLNNGWDFVCHKFYDHYFGKYILFSHKPREIDDKIDLNIHGHFHNSDHRWREPELIDRLTDRHKLFCLEEANYQPILLSTFIEKNYDHSQKDCKILKGTRA
jgi:calcineurin-like phosphoesterase family protein